MNPLEGTPTNLPRGITTTGRVPKIGEAMTETANDSLGKLKAIVAEWPHDFPPNSFNRVCYPSCRRCAVQHLIPVLEAERDRLLEPFEKLVSEWRTNRPANIGRGYTNELESAIRAAKGKSDG